MALCSSHPILTASGISTHSEVPPRLFISWHLLATKNFRTDIMACSAHPIFGETVRLMLEVFLDQLLICINNRLLKVLGL